MIFTLAPLWCVIFPSLLPGLVLVNTSSQCTELSVLIYGVDSTKRSSVTSTHIERKKSLSNNGPSPPHLPLLCDVGLAVPVAEGLRVHPRWPLTPCIAGHWKSYLKRLEGDDRKARCFFVDIQSPKVSDLAKATSFTIFAVWRISGCWSCSSRFPMRSLWVKTSTISKQPE